MNEIINLLVSDIPTNHPVGSRVDYLNKKTNEVFECIYEGVFSDAGSPATQFQKLRINKPIGPAIQLLDNNAVKVYSCIFVPLVAQ